ncbi:MAG TPA: DbpA RNA binding domain-containing protein, partial [Polyangia bacterium]|nr:DbpA RNA binding domain-containing protein [Polyangia bacterium]
DALALRLEAELPAPALIRRLLARELGRLPAGESVQTIAAPRLETERGFGGGRDSGFGARNERPHPRDRAELSKEAVLFRVNIGARDNADPRWMLPLICKRGGVTRREVGAIRIGPHETTFEIAGHAAHEFTDAAAEPDPRARHVIISRADAGPAAPTPGPEQGFTPHAARPEHPSKRRDGFAPFSPARDKRPPQAEPRHSVKPEPHSVKPEPHSASGHQAKPHAGAKPRPHGKPYPGAKPHTHAKPSYVKPSYMKTSHANPAARPKDKHRKG